MTGVLERLRAELAGRYTIERELGAGATATVFLARDERHHRPVAIKVLNPELGSALGGGRFLREIDTVARLHHPHILPLFDSGDADGLLWFAMPYVVETRLRPQTQIDVLWLDGLVAAARRDTIRLDQIRGSLAASELPDAAPLGRSLSAFAADLRGNSIAAGRQLADLEWEIAQQSRARQFGSRHASFMAVNRLAAARRLTAAGDAATAERLLHFPEAVLTSRAHEQANRALEGAVWFERGRIEEAGGRMDAAVRAYRRVLEEYDQPVPRLRWMVDAAQSGITKLRR